MREHALKFAGALICLAALLFSSHAIAAGISGTITLTPEAGFPVSVEVEASQNGEMKGRSVITISYSGAYNIQGLIAGSYLVEAHAPGYEIRMYPSSVTVGAGTTTGIDITLSSAWPLFKQDRWHTGNSPYADFKAPLILNWSYIIPNVRSSPVISGGKIIIGGSTGNNRIFAVNDDGTFSWSYVTADHYWGNCPAVANDKVYAGDWDGYLYVFNLANGSLKWSYKAAETIEGSPTVVNNMVYFGSADNSFRAVKDNDSSGTLKWSLIRRGYCYYPADPAVSNGVVYFSEDGVWPDGGRLYAVNDTGVFKWSFVVAQESVWPPSVYRGAIYFGADNGVIFAVREDKSLKWSTPLGSSAALRSNPVLANGVLYCAAMDHKVYSLDAELGTVRWSYPAANLIYGPAVSNGVVYFVAWYDAFYAVRDDVTHGTLLWSWPVAAAQGAPAIANGMIIVPENHRILAFSNGGYIRGSVNLIPSRNVTVEIEASIDGELKRKAVVFGSGSYSLGVPSGVYSLEAHAPGYEIKIAGPFSIEAGGSAEADFSLNSAWPMLKQDRGHTADSLDSLITPPLSFRWSHPTSGPIGSSASIVNGKLYFGSDDNVLRMINHADGSFLFSYGAGGDINSTPLVADGKVYVGAHDSRLYCLSATNLGFIWSYVTNAATIESDPVYSGGRVYFGSHDSNLYAVNAFTGGLEWSYQAGEYVYSSPAARDGVVFFGSYDNKLYAVSAGTGSYRWSFDSGGDVVRAPAVHGGRVVFASNPRTFHARSTADGSFLWSLQFGSSAGIITMSPAISGGKVYVGFASLLEPAYQDFYALDEASGAISWSFNLYDSSGPFFTVYTPAVANGNVYFGAADTFVSGKFFALDADDGSFKWSYSGTPFVPAPSIYDGELFVGSIDGNLYAFESAGSIKGSITLDPPRSVSVEVSASIDGEVKERVIMTGDGQYEIGGLNPGSYVVDVHAPGYEIGLYPTEVAVTAGNATEGIDFSLGAAWPTFRQDKWRTGNSPDTHLDTPFIMKWSFTAGQHIYSSPAVVNGAIYFGSDDSNLYAIQDNGGSYTFKWSFPTGGYVYSSPTVVNGTIYVGSWDYNLYALQDNGSSYTLKWSFLTGKHVHPSPTAANGVIYVGSNDCRLYALVDNGSSCTFKWSFRTGGFVSSSPSVVNGTIYFGSSDSNLYAIQDNGSSCTFKWSFPAGHIVFSSPAVVNGVIYAGSNDFNLYALQDNGSSCTFKWSFPAGSYIYSSPAAVNGTIYFGSSDFNLYAIQDNGSSYAFKWSFPAGDDIYSSPAVANGIIYFGSFDSNLYAIRDNGSSYTFEWSFTGGSDVYSSPAVASGSVYFGSGRYLCAFDKLVSIRGSITLNPDHPVSVEVVAYQDGDEKGRGFVTGSGPYFIEGLSAGTYSVEAHAPGYEIVPYGAVTVVSGDTARNVDMTLNAAWPTYMQDKWHTGASPDTLIGTPLKFKWRFETENGIGHSSPAVLNGKVFIGSMDSTLYCVDESSGSFAWSFVTSALINSSPALAYGMVFVGSNDNSLYALDQSTGVFRWSYETGSSIAASPAVAGGRVYFGSNDNNIYALNAHNGSFRWSYETAGAVELSSPVVDNGSVFVPSELSLCVLHDDSGNFKWSCVAAVGRFCSPTLVNGRVVLGSSNGWVYSHNQENGAFQWSFYIAAMSGTDTSLSSANGLVFVSGINGVFYALRESNGDLAWSYPISSPIYGSPAVGGGAVFFGSNDNAVYALDASDGTYRWSYETDGFVQSSPAILGGKVFFGSRDNFLYAFENAPPTSEGFQVSNLRISREADSAGSAVILTWDPTSEVDVWSTTEGYTSWEGWVMEGSTTESRWHDPNQVGAGDDEKYYKVVLHNVGATAIGSADAVGKVNIDCSPGYSLISVPFDSDERGINKVIGSQLTSGNQLNADAIYHKAGAGSSVFKKAYLSATGWLDAATGNPSTILISPEAGYFIEVGSGNPARDVTVVGRVIADERTVTMEVGYSMVGSVFVKDISLADSESNLYSSGALPGNQLNADAIFYKPSASSSSYKKAYLSSSDNQWHDAATGAANPFGIMPRFGYFYQRQGASSLKWVRPSPY